MMIEIRDDGIYDVEKYFDNPIYSNERLIMSKEVFVKAFEKYILPRLDCVDTSAAGTSPTIRFLRK